MTQKTIPERHKLRCINAGRYRAMKAPRCNAGRPCLYCRQLWAKAQANALIMRNRQLDQVG